ncbi:4,4'-diaponeurosporenoate glycosyltransferase [Rubripirellula tenax]|uniref:4,4'-diaponeurosporenoate glycosyltransferase n=1 Tax=Rubripirellula tenax TaxID=2528015 RepID=A0A5C6EC01_9BACT|nr:glycosyltransferase family 2 protein [Rubripirellula tenax]TWU46260.1 4,4'-diaponeurosporenoate glycosyltransferase [Rubripirellula tenax]
MILVLSILGLVLAMIPLAMFMTNLPLFCVDETDFAAHAPMESDRDRRVSVLIPARDEESAIAKSVSAALASHGVEVEIVVLDDHSTDETATVVRKMAASDSRVRLIESEALPKAWNGKQHACFQLAAAATHDRMVFLDADVRLSPGTLWALTRRQDKTGVDLLSAFPHQETGTWLEKWIIPLMHYILLGFLPLVRMRSSTHPSYASGCGQLFMTRKSAYTTAGTHEAIKSSRHDGLKLPRAYRNVGLSTDVIDGTALAECRMYTDASQVVRGVLKNAVEGIANPRLIVPFSVLLVGGSVLPIVTLAAAIAGGKSIAVFVSIAGVIAGHLPRAIAAKRLRQPIAGVLFHSVAVTIFVFLQWIALVNHLCGRQVAWRGRNET